MSSRENIQITGNSLDELRRSLNFAFQRIADRLDKIEGVRGQSTVQSDLNLSGNSLINAGNFDQNLGTDDAPQFGGLTIDGDVAITNDLAVTNDFTSTTVTASGAIDGDSITVTDSNSTVIHKFS